MIQKPDSLIFDMDGTLWDAGDCYTAAWNKGLKLMNVDKVFQRSTLDHLMGWERKKALEYILPEYDENEREAIYEEVVKAQDEMLPITGGKMYEGVKEGLKALSEVYSLFIVSNCPKGTIKQFIKWAGITSYITDEMAHGVNSRPKDYNIRLLMDQYRLKHPVYIGDTEGDQVQSERAGLPFVFVSYGFGSTDKYELKFDSFTALTTYFLSL
jgi:phosphoglycolate phosphatase